MIYIVRHGQTHSNIDGIIQGQSVDASLNETGIEQAKHVASLLKFEPIDLIISSDLLRAFQTAQIISNELHLKIEKDERLREMSFGSWEGKTFSEISNTPEGRLWEEHSSEWKMEGAETLKNVQQRFITSVVDHARRSGDILIVSHGAAISAFLLYVKNLSLDLVKNNFPANGAILKFKFENDHFNLM